MPVTSTKSSAIGIKVSISMSILPLKDGHCAKGQLLNDKKLSNELSRRKRNGVRLQQLIYLSPLLLAVYSEDAESIVWVFLSINNVIICIIYFKACFVAVYLRSKCSVFKLLASKFCIFHALWTFLWLYQGSQRHKVLFASCRSAGRYQKSED